MKLVCSILFLITVTSGICFPVYSQEFNIREFNTNIQSSTFQDSLSIQENKSTQETKSLQDSIVVKLAGNRLLIENMPKSDILEVYNIMGVKVYNRRINAGTNEYILSLPKGYYILKIGKLTKKIAIR